MIARTRPVIQNIREEKSMGRDSFIKGDLGCIRTNGTDESEKNRGVRRRQSSTQSIGGWGGRDVPRETNGNAGRDVFHP